jgi:hypothetical protein
LDGRSFAGWAEAGGKGKEGLFWDPVGCNLSSDIDMKSGRGWLVWVFLMLTLPPPSRNHRIIDRIRTPNRKAVIEMILQFPAIVRTIFFEIKHLQNYNNESI